MPSIQITITDSSVDYVGGVPVRSIGLLASNQSEEVPSAKIFVLRKIGDTEAEYVTIATVADFSNIPDDIADATDLQPYFRSEEMIWSTDYPDEGDAFLVNIKRRIQSMISQLALLDAEAVGTTITFTA